MKQDLPFHVWNSIGHYTIRKHLMIPFPFILETVISDLFYDNRSMFCRMCDKTSPRFTLSCSHSLCENCLELVTVEHQITCPWCQNLTESKDVQPFSITQEMHRIKKNICDVCHRKQIVYKCLDCPNKMCENCTDSHNMLKPFRHHRVVLMCEDHGEQVTHICMLCMVTGCPKCIIQEHYNHGGSVKDYDAGISEILSEAAILSSRLKDTFVTVTDSRKNTLTRKSETQRLRNELKEAKNYHVLKATEADNILTEVEEVYQEVTSDDKNKGHLQNDIRHTCETLDHLMITSARDANLLPKIINLTQNAEQLLLHTQSLPKRESQFLDNETRMCLQRSRTVSDTNHVVSGTMERSRTVSDTNHVVLGTNSFQRNFEARLVVDCKIGNRVYKKRSVHVICFRSNSAIITCNEGQVMTRVSTTGDIIGRWEHPFKECGDIRLVSVYGNNVYLASSKIITLYKGSIRREIYRPDICSILHFCVVTSNLFIITTGDGEGVYEYNPIENTTKLVVEADWYPTYIGVKHDEENGNRYLITDEDSHLVKVFDTRWSLLYCIGFHIPGSSDGQFNLPMGTAVTSEGILVADHRNHRVSLFSNTGQFKRHVVLQEHGVWFPEGIAFSSPYLWVTSRGTIKCFTIKLSK